MAPDNFNDDVVRDTPDVVYHNRDGVLRPYVAVDALLRAPALEAAHWKLDGTLCDFDEDTGKYEPVEADEETVLRDCIEAAADAVIDSVAKSEEEN